MKTIIIASGFALAAMAWTSQANATFFCWPRYYPGCHNISHNTPRFIEACQAKCVNAKTSKQRRLCYETCR
jgi:hypothetical protein